MTFIPSPEQQSIFDAVLNTRDNIAISALAGTGKTTTLVELSRLLPPQGSKIFCAFNKDIVSELEHRLRGTNMQAKTFHSIGFSALKKYLNSNQMAPDGSKYRNIVQSWADGSEQLAFLIAEATAHAPQDEREDLRKQYFRATVSMAVDLLSLLRYKLAEWDDTTALAFILDTYDLADEINYNEDIIALIIATVPDWMRAAEKATRDLSIDFTDMIYWPVRWNVSLYQYTWVFVDEAQDLSPMQREMIRRIIWEKGGRIVLVGDKNQAIYAFAGADSNSFDLSVSMFKACVMPLTVTRRCAAIITQHAAGLVPAFRCPEDKPRGKVVYIDEAVYGCLQSGDLVVSRIKAPLVDLVLKLLGDGKAATILGADIGKSLIALLEKLSKRKGYTFARLGDILDQYEEERVNYYMNRNDEQKAEALRDSCAALRVILQRAMDDGRASDLDAINAYISSLFSDDKKGSVITLSTIHKSKGLEAERVFILRPDRLPLLFGGQSAETVQQEYNLDYVARTRAKSVLVYFTNPAWSKNNSVPAYGQTSFEDMSLPALPLPAPEIIISDMAWDTGINGPHAVEHLYSVPDGNDWLDYLPAKPTAEPSASEPSASGLNGRFHASGNLQHDMRQWSLRNQLNALLDSMKDDEIMRVIQLLTTVREIEKVGS